MKQSQTPFPASLALSESERGRLRDWMAQQSARIGPAYSRAWEAVAEYGRQVEALRELFEGEEQAASRDAFRAWWDATALSLRARGEVRPPAAEGLEFWQGVAQRGGFCALYSLSELFCQQLVTPLQDNAPRSPSDESSILGLLQRWLRQYCFELWQNFDGGPVPIQAGESTAEPMEATNICSNLAHDLRNPLAAILSSHFLLQKRLQGLEPELQPRVDRHLGVIKRQVGVCQELIQAVLDLQDPAAWKPEKVLLRTLFEQCRDELFSTAPDDALHLSLGGDALDLQFQAHRRLLLQALKNLLLNAQTALREAAVSPAEIRLDVNLRTKASLGGVRNDSSAFLVIEVIDNGPGYAPALLEEFASNQVRSRSGGYGLGLLWVKLIVQRLGGQMHLDRAASGGARAEMCFPFQSS